MVAIERAENRTEKMLRQLQAKKEPVVLFGAALCGERYLQILRDNGIEVAFFADDDKEKQAKGVAGLPVVPAERLSSWGGADSHFLLWPRKSGQAVARDGCKLDAATA